MVAVSSRRVSRNINVVADDDVQVCSKAPMAGVDDQRAQVRASACFRQQLQGQEFARGTHAATPRPEPQRSCRSSARHPGGLAQRLSCMHVLWVCVPARLTSS